MRIQGRGAREVFKRAAAGGEHGNRVTPGVMHVNSAQAYGGQRLAIGGAEDRAAGGSELLRTFAELSGGRAARIVLVTAASGTPGVSFAEYSAAFHRLGGS